MKIKILLFLTFLIAGCAQPQYSPEELISANIKAAQEEDAEARWSFASKATQQKMLEKSSKEKVFEKLRYEAFMYKLIKSWETEILSQTEDKASVLWKYKMFDPHSNKIISDKSTIKLVKEDGFWKIDK